MRHYLRLSRLVALVRLRTVGWVPWLLLLAWSLVAAAQEPTIFRSYGVRLTGQGIWGGAVALTLLLFSVERNTVASAGIVASLLANACLAVCVASAQSALSFGMDLLFGYSGSGAASLGSPLCFTIACLPLAVVAATAAVSRMQVFVKAWITTIGAGCLVAVSIDCGTVDLQLTTLLASALATAGASLFCILQKL